MTDSVTIRLHRLNTWGFPKDNKVREYRESARLHDLSIVKGDGSCIRGPLSKIIPWLKVVQSEYSDKYAIFGLDDNPLLKPRFHWGTGATGEALYPTEVAEIYEFPNITMRKYFDRRFACLARDRREKMTPEDVDRYVKQWRDGVRVGKDEPVEWTQIGEDPDRELSIEEVDGKIVSKMIDLETLSYLQEEFGDNHVYQRILRECFIDRVLERRGGGGDTVYAECHRLDSATKPCIGIIELGGGYRLDDLEKYWEHLRLPKHPEVISVSVDGAHNSPGDPADMEVVLDIEIVGAIVGDCKIVVYFAPNTDRGFYDAIRAALDDKENNPSVISISWGAPEVQWDTKSWISKKNQLQAYDELFAEAAERGITVCCAAGDNGSSDGIQDGKQHCDFPGSSPHVLSCGGTRLYCPDRNYYGTLTQEIVWEENGATGGGISKFFANPDYQQVLGFSNRGVPDVAGVADPVTGWKIWLNGHEQVVGGTSAVAPMWAALLALLNCKKFVNPILYKNYFMIPQGNMWRNVMGITHDITKGKNGKFSATQGWDACTGLGTPAGHVLMQVFRFQDESGTLHPVISDEQEDPKEPVMNLESSETPSSPEKHFFPKELLQDIEKHSWERQRETPSSPEKHFFSKELLQDIEKHFWEQQRETPSDTPEQEKSKTDTIFEIEEVPFVPPLPPTPPVSPVAQTFTRHHQNSNTNPRENPNIFRNVFQYMMKSWER